MNHLNQVIAINSVITLLNGIDVDGETMEYIIDHVGMRDQMKSQLGVATDMLGTRILSPVPDEVIGAGVGVGAVTGVVASGVVVVVPAEGVVRLLAGTAIYPGPVGLGTRTVSFEAVMVDTIVGVITSGVATVGVVTTGVATVGVVTSGVVIGASIYPGPVGFGINYTPYNFLPDDEVFEAFE